MRKVRGRHRRHRIIRKKIFGTGEKPRLCVFRSHQNFYAQLIDDIGGRTLFSLGTHSKELKKEAPKGGNLKASDALGREFAKKAKAKGFGKVVFDRAGYMYHGRIKAFADAARKEGLIF